MRSGFGGLLAAVMLLVVAGCSTFHLAPSSGENVLPSSAPPVVGAETPSRREHARILAAYGGAYNDPKLDRMLGKLVSELAAHSDEPTLTCRVHVLNSPSINAFALPTGDIYVTRGLLALANDTSEIGAVLAHEIGHITARHAFKRADREKQALLVSRVMTDVLNDSDGGALQLAKSKLALASFSREQELEADELGVATLARAGYDPRGAARFLTAMERNARLQASGFGTAAGDTMDFMANHPSTPERIRLVTQEAEKLAEDSDDKTARGAYLSAIEGLVFGDDPSQGYVEGNKFIHPVIGFEFEAPRGFRLENAADSIVGVGPNDTALRFDASKLGNDRPLTDHLAAELMDGVTISAVQTTNVNGFPAVLAVATGQDWKFRLAAIRFGSDVYRFVYAARQLTPDIDAAFLSSIRSFRRLASATATDIRPMRIAIVKVKEGDTVSSLAARMADPDDKAVERFMVLNGLTGSSKIKVGEKVKIIVQ